MNDLERYIGGIPYRLVLAGGWIDQPFVNRHNPEPPGAMVVVSLVPEFRWMERCGLATSTRNIARRIWKDRLPDRPPMELVRELYEAENAERHDPSGSQDMAGIIYPGISRLDYTCNATYPTVTSTVEEETCAWLQSVLWVLPVFPRPFGYDPLCEQHLVGKSIAALGKTGHECWQAIEEKDIGKLGSAMNGYHEWAGAILPKHNEHSQIQLEPIWQAYSNTYPGAVYSGCGGGYMIVASERPVPGSFSIKVRRS